MKTRMVILALLLLLLTCPSGVLAGSWLGHYEVDVTVSTLGVNSYNFTYAVTNLDQGTGAPVGLDGFYVQVPLTATISNITDPPSYGGSGGWWEHFLPGGNPGLGFQRHPATRLPVVTMVGYVGSIRLPHWGDRNLQL